MWNRVVYIVFILGLLLQQPLRAQVADTTAQQHNNTLTMAAVGAGVYAAGITGLYFLWYKDYEYGPLHVIDDSRAWLQMDKLGHTFSNYQIARGAYYGFRQTGTPESHAILLGTAYSLAFFSTVEILDGVSQGWGFSWGDMAVDVVGNALFAAQQYIWHEQRIQLKFSYTPTKYAAYYPNLLGHNAIERGLKDYNGQTYWLSVNPASFCQNSPAFLPKWLNISLGYGAKGMIGAYHNPATIEGKSLPPFQRQRQYYLSLDIDLSKIKTRSRFLNHFLVLANCLKIPFPTLEYNAEDGWQFHPIMF